MLLRPKHTRAIYNNLPQQLPSKSVNFIRIENSIALFLAKSRNLIGTEEIAQFGPK